MRRLTLSTKLFAAALPLVLAVGALLALTVRNDLNEVAEAERGADLGAVWTPLVEGLNSIETELANMPAKPDESTTGGIAEVDPEQAAQLTAMRRATDQVLTRLGDEVGDLGAAQAARKHITQARTEISGARRAIDMASLAPGMSTDIDPLEAYDSALRQLVSVGHLLPAESGDAQLGRELLAVVKLAEARVASDAVIAHVQKFQSDESNASPLATAQVRYAEIESVMNEFSAIAPEEWAQQFRQSDFTTALSQFRFQLDSARRAAEAGAGAQFDLTGFEALSDRSLALQQQITGSIVERASAQANETRQTVFVRLLIALGAVLIASLTAWLLTRSVTRRVKTVSRRANQVANEQLPALVDAIRDPRGKTVLPTIEPVDTRGSDELAELAHAFNSMQATLVDVANEQVEVLRRGVSEIFVTMARRNRSLIDRQLAMLDEFEAEVDDPEVLANYYQLDHMATRMRRNSESLLVLANAEPKRRRVKATEIDDVVRAAIGEVEDYRRIEVETLENLQVRGNVVADVSHLLAELLDNATSFSPPDSVVRVGGRRAGDSYMLRIVDGGVGISPDRLFELNELLREPPIVGLSVEPTLGMSVVSLLGSRHGVIVTLSQGNPGTTVDVLLPSSMFGPIDIPGPDAIGPASLPRLAAEATAVPQQGLMATTDLAIDPTPATGTPFDRELEPVAAAEPTAFERTVEPDTTPSWTTMSLDLAGLRAEPSRAAEAALVDPTPIASPGLFADIPGLVDDDFESAPLGGSSAASFAESFAPDETGTVETGTVETGTVEPGTVEQHDTSAADPILGLRIPDLTSSQPEADEQPAPPPFDSLPTRSVAASLPEPLAPAPKPELSPASASAGEFDRLPAPPLTVDGLARRPVSDDDARPASTVKLPAPSLEAGLPTRTPSRGPDGGFDRMAPPTGPSVTPDMPVAPTSSPSALQAALAAFDSRRNGGDSLPTRSRNDTSIPASFDEPASTTQSRLDPEVLRERLRAFQNEFRTASSVASDNLTDHSSTNADLGGDR